MAVQEREAALSAVFTDNTVPIRLCRSGLPQGSGPKRGRVFVTAEVDEAGSVREAKVGRIVGEPGLAVVAREDALGTRYFPVHRRGIPVRTSFEYCLVFRSR